MTALSTAPPTAGAEVAVRGHLRRSDLVRCFTNQICIDGECSSSCASPLVVSATAEPTAAQRDAAQRGAMVAPGDIATQSSCEGDQHGLCCPYEAVADEVVVTGKVVAEQDAPQRWHIEVASVCRASAG